MQAFRQIKSSKMGLVEKKKNRSLHDRNIRALTGQSVDLHSFMKYTASATYMPRIQSLILNPPSSRPIGWVSASGDEVDENGRTLDIIIFASSS